MGSDRRSTKLDTVLLTKFVEVQAVPVLYIRCCLVGWEVGLYVGGGRLFLADLCNSYDIKWGGIRRQSVPHDVVPAPVGGADVRWRYEHLPQRVDRSFVALEPWPVGIIEEKGHGNFGVWWAMCASSVMALSESGGGSCGLGAGPVLAGWRLFKVLEEVVVACWTLALWIRRTLSRSCQVRVFGLRELTEEEIAWLQSGVQQVSSVNVGMVRCRICAYVAGARSGGGSRRKQYWASVDIAFSFVLGGRCWDFAHNSCPEEAMAETCAMGSSASAVS